MAALRLLALACVSFLLILGGQSVQAQDNDALRFFQQNPQGRIWFRNQPQPTRPVIRQRPREENVVRRRAPRPRPQSEAPAEAPAEIAVAPQPIVPASIFVHVLGDSLSELLAQGLKEQLIDKPEIGIVRRGRSSSGLVRDDYHDWAKVLREAVHGPDKIDMLIMMIGSNDRQVLRDETGSHEFMSERWREIYTKRIDDLLSVAREKRLPMAWVGMPVMQSARLTADMLAINEIVRDRVTKGGFAYVDIWEGFANEQGQYAVAGPDINGETVRLRMSDGVHFTKAGARKLGFFASREVDRQLARDRPTGVEVAALPPDLSDELKRNAAAGALQPALPAIALPGELPVPVIIRERPLIGPLAALTAAPVAAGGQLLKARPAQPVSEMTLLIEQALTQGRLPPSKPGRTDDFRWPRE
jgi:uncharacterized protein